MKDLGVLVPIVSPCKPSGDLDLAGLKSVTRYLLDAGCHAFFVAGSTGRGPWFSRADRIKICQTVAGQIGSNVPFFAGCMASGLSEMLDNTRAMKDSGAKFAVLTAPGYFSYSQQEVEAIFLKFADASPLPVMIYDIPAFTGMKLDMDMVKRLSGHGNVIGFKDSSADLDRFKQLLAALKDKSNFYLLQGKEHILADSLFAGASGLVVSLLHIDPRPFVALYHACRENNVEKAARCQSAIAEVYKIVGAAFQRRPETSTLFFLLNYPLKKRGVCANILLDHEGQCPAWLAEEAEKNMQIFEKLK
jgi:dihydrodipicolinate synthase/N-acetylneuraminate lyase